jgi:TonB family protein
MLSKILLRLCSAGLSFCVSSGLVTATRRASSPHNTPPPEFHKNVPSADSSLVPPTITVDPFPYPLESVCQLPLKVIKRVNPKYPPLEACAHLRGEIRVEVDIGADGHVISAKAISGPLLLRAGSVDAAMNWRFQPPRINNRPIECYAILTFKLNPDGRKSVETRTCRTS